MRVRQSHYRPGDHLVVSDRSGRTFWRSECRKQWDGLIVHESEFEERHPQDFVTTRAEKINVRDARPMTSEDFLGDTEVTRASLSIHFNQ